MLLSGIQETLRSYLGALVSGLGFQVPAARYGEDYVPRDDMLYRLHRGERVLTAQENQAYTSGRGNGAITINVPVTVHADSQTDGHRLGREIGNEIVDALRTGKARRAIKDIVGIP